VRNPFYQIVALWEDADAIGWQAAVRLQFGDSQACTEISRSPTPEIELKNSEFPRLMRTHTSDRAVLGRVFIQKEYAPIELSSPKVILHLSTNIGY